MFSPNVQVIELESPTLPTDVNPTESTVRGEAVNVIAEFVKLQKISGEVLINDVVRF